MPIMHATARGFRSLALANWRELIRDPKTILYIVMPPIMLMGVFLLIAASVTSSQLIHVTVPANADQAVLGSVETLKHLSGTSVEVTDAQKAGELKASGLYDVIITMPASLEGASITVDVNPNSSTQAWQVQSILEQITRKSGSPTVMVASTGRVDFDPGKFASSGILLYALASLAMFGIATPMVSMRQRGLLRILATKPVSRLTFILAQVPARLGFALGLTIVALTVVALKWEITWWRLAAAFGIAILGFLFFASLGYLIGGTFSSTEAATNVLAALLPFGLIAGGVILPLQSLPLGWVQKVPWFIPVGYLGDAMRQVLFAEKPMAPFWIDLLVTVVTTAVFTLLAVRNFRWDQSERGQVRTPNA